MVQQSSVQKTGIYYGILTGVASIIYIIIIKLLGLIEEVGLHFLTGLILVAGVCLAIKKYKENKSGSINYLEGIGIGGLVGLISGVLYSIFQVIADYTFNLGYSYPYKADDSYGGEQSIWLVAVTWVIMGIVIGSFVGYIAMQFFKRPDHKLSDI